MVATASEAYFPWLREIRGIDCPTPKCRANACCTGRVKWEASGQFWVETECPDCRELDLHATPETNRLGEALLGAASEAREPLIRDFVRTRPEGPHPLR